MRALLEHNTVWFLRSLFVLVCFFFFQSSILTVSANTVNSGFDPHHPVSENHVQDQTESSFGIEVGRGRVLSKSKAGSERKVLQSFESRAAKGSSNLWKVGSYKNIRGLEAGLDAHHVGQRAVMKRLIPGYNPSTAPAILVPKAGHTIGQGVVNRTTSGFTNARQVLARDIFELRRVYGSQGLSNSSLQQLIKMNKQMYPGAFIK